LDAQDNGIAQSGREQVSKPVHTPAVWWFGAGHFEDLPANQLEAFVFGEEADVRHAVVFIHGEPLSGDAFGRHDHEDTPGFFGRHLFRPS
jgi:hypothetical protein